MSGSERLSDLDLERSYLCTLVSGMAPAELRSSDRLRPHELSYAAHQVILAAAHSLHDRETGTEIGELQVASELEREGRARFVTTLREVADGMPELGSFPAIAERLRKLAGDREMLGNLQRAQAAVLDGRVDDAREMAIEASAISQTVLDAPKIETAYDTAASAIIELTERRTRDIARSGFPLLDAAIGGFAPGTMAVLGGVTGSGKSSLVLAAAFKMVQREGHRVGIVSCEDAQIVWGSRVLGHVGGVNSERFFSPHSTDEFVRECEAALEHARGVGIEFAYAQNRPLRDVLRAIRTLAVERRCNVIAVDYIQAIRLGERDRREAVIDAIGAINEMCKALDVALIMCSQLRRAPNDRPFREPTAGDLKEAGELENNADIAIVLWKSSDAEDAEVFGKVAKVKWSPRRPRFTVIRSPSTGVIEGLMRPTEPEPSEDAGHRRRRDDWS